MALQLQKDARHMRLGNQIEMIQQELVQLTGVELEQRQLKMDIQKVWTLDLGSDP